MIQLVILGLYINLILVYTDQSSEYVVANGEHLVCQQQKALYGLKQYHCVWLDQFSAIVLGYGFQCYTSIQSVFVCHPTIGIIVMIVYVGDITFGIDSTSIVDMKSYLAKQFHTKDLGVLHYLLKIGVACFYQGIFLSQREYVLDLL